MIDVRTQEKYKSKHYDFIILYRCLAYNLHAPNNSISWARQFRSETKSGVFRDGESNGDELEAILYNQCLLLCDVDVNTCFSLLRAIAQEKKAPNEEIPQRRTRTCLCPLRFI